TEQALEYAVAAIEADPTDLQYYLNYAFALLQAKRSDLAAPQLGSSICAKSALSDSCRIGA
ncbi:MAG: hypothetical protein WBM40_00965, partial [Thiohalocapsa sp.]